MKTNAIMFSRTGEAEVLNFQPIELPELKSTDVLIRHHAVGVNFVDTYYRSGLYKVSLPSGLGTEAAGVIEAVGTEVTHFKVGDRVAYATGPLGAYAEKRVLDSKYLVKLSDEISYEQATASLLKGLTVHYLFNKVHQLKKDQTILFHAASGGVGLIACQWAKHVGAKLIGTVSSDDKAQIAKKSGAWEVINYKTENVSERVRELTDGKKVPVVFDGIGKATWEISLDCLSPRGLMVSFGNASGPVTGVDLGILSQKGSLFVTRPTLAHFVSTQEELALAASDLFSLIKTKEITIDPPKTFPLKDAAKAHVELMNRSRTGAIVLV